MKFQDKFKSGDIICSEDFYNGLCMVVEYGVESPFGGYAYTCIDLVKDSQRWRAYESSRVDTFPYNWRIATDDDIANYLTRFLDIPLSKVREYDVEYGVYFTADELIQLGKIINERILK